MYAYKLRTVEIPVPEESENSDLTSVILSSEEDVWHITCANLGGQLSESGSCKDSKTLASFSWLEGIQVGRYVEAGIRIAWRGSRPIGTAVCEPENVWGLD